MNSEQFHMLEQMVDSAFCEDVLGGRALTEACLSLEVEKLIAAICKRHQLQTPHGSKEEKIENLYTAWRKR